MTISPNTVLNYLAQGMGEYLHWFPQDVTVERLATVLAGMANTRGGMVLIGISPRTGNVQGVLSFEKIVDLVFQAALRIEPPLVLPIPEKVDIEGRQVVALTVPSGLPRAYSFDGRYFMRAGKQTSPFSARALRQLLISRGDIQFESLQPPDAIQDDLDAQQIDEYLKTLNLEKVESQSDILQRRGCLRFDDHGVLRPTYAGLLLFGRYPQRWLPNATILVARFTGTAMSDTFIKQEVSGPLPNQLRQVEAFVRQNVRHVVRLVGLERQETPEYPLAAVREVLVNAVAHRDYNLQGDNIHVFLYADRLEIHSPGDLPGPVNLDNLLEARFSRNAVIAQTLSDMGFVERLGYGLNRVISLTAQQGLPAPFFCEVGRSFRVTLFAPKLPASLPDIQEYQHLGLNDRQQQALAYLATHGRITNRDYQNLCPDVHPETLRRDLVDLISKGVALKIGQKKATYYILKSVKS